MPLVKPNHSVEDLSISEMSTISSYQDSKAISVPKTVTNTNRFLSKWDSDYCESTCSEKLLTSKTHRESIFFEENVMSEGKPERNDNSPDHYFRIFT